MGQTLLPGKADRHTVLDVREEETKVDLERTLRDRQGREDPRDRQGKEDLRNRQGRDLRNRLETGPTESN